ncbi:lipid-A-disaccharide synthase [Rhodovibrio salinarum]|uniref:Lipid-A-disaccharide synthase n=1 Tax=Rhodovibrio salinarum TaxID=1087 RepID=A0A934QIW7_9PROT|nr:lipid-A-disaccharide synthase [Rhodovibrio salinarum]MBK1697821.1 lipid-A-disaccharide synthase [Rhodovibrio salinarum]
MTSTTGGPLIFLVAGEPSGDQLGARLMAELKAETGGRVRFAGVGGDRMEGEGLQSLFPMSDLSVMGLAEVLPHLPRILTRMRQTVAAARALRPDAVVTIDSPSFTLRVMHKLTGIGCPRIHYVAPQVWAWKPWRAKAMAGYLDRLLTLLPFEPPIFEQHGLATDFVGHPVVETAGRTFDTLQFRAQHTIPTQAPLICLLPGSRKSEVKRLLPVFEETVALLAQQLPDLHVVLPTVAGVERRVRRVTRAWPVPVTVVTGTEERYTAFAASHAAIAASGTVAVELAVAQLPTVVAYRVNRLTAFLARRLIHVRYVSLPNLVMDRPIQPEMLQEDCTPTKLADALQPLLDDTERRAAYVSACQEAAKALGAFGEPPSRKAARIVLEAAGADR